MDAATPREVRLRRLAWMSIVALAAALRFLPISCGLPYIDYVDEGHVLHQTVQFFKTGTVNIGNYSYPWLPGFLVTGGVQAYAPIYHLVHGRSLRSDLFVGSKLSPPVANYYDLISPAEMIVMGRVVIALLSVATVILAGALGSQLGGAATGLGAMLLTAVCPALVSRGSIVIIDTIAAFLILALLWFCAQLRRAPWPAASRRTGGTGAVPSAAARPSTPRRASLQRLARFDKLILKLKTRPRSATWLAAGAGAMAGLAFASKYTMAIAPLAIIAAVAFLPARLGRKAVLLASAGAAAMVAAAFANPVLVLEPAKLAESMRGISAFYNTIGGETYWDAAISSGELGLPLVASGFAGILWMLLRSSARPAAINWLVFTLVLLAILLPHRFQPFRSLLVAVPFLCIAAAFFFVELSRYVKTKAPGNVIAMVAPVLFATLAGSLLIFSSQQSYRRMSHIDTRLRAIDWLRENTIKSHRILATEELAIFPSEWKRIRGKVEVVPWTKALERLRQESFDFVVSGEFMLGFAPDPETLAAYRSEWTAELAPMQVAAKFGQVETPTNPGVWRTNDQRILILARPPR